MSSQANSASLWDESMRIGVIEFDEERRELMAILERLDVNPLQTISSEYFLVRFTIYEAAVRALFLHEEVLFVKFNVSNVIIQRHKKEHDQIMTGLNDVYIDSMNKKNQTAIDIYHKVRAVFVPTEFQAV